MNKLFITTLVAFSVSGIAHAIEETKQQKLEQLFALTVDTATMRKAYEPVFTGVKITDEKTKKQILDTFLNKVKQDYLVVHDKYFTDAELDAMLTFYQSEVGKKVIDTVFDISTEMRAAYGSIMPILQETLAAQAKDASAQQQTAETAQSKCVVSFHELAQGKNDAEVRELFNKEIQHDGITVVKFAAQWCGPCKFYAPIFAEVAEQLQEVAAGDTNVPVKYLTVDIDKARLIAQDCAITSVPTTAFYKNGKKVDAKVGSFAKDALMAKIKELAQ